MINFARFLFYCANVQSDNPRFFILQINILHSKNAYIDAYNDYARFLDASHVTSESHVMNNQHEKINYVYTKKLNKVLLRTPST